MSIYPPVVGTVNGGLANASISLAAGSGITLWASSLSSWYTTSTGTAGSGGGSGTVTSASVATANGFAGTVANPTTTPAITVETTVTGIMKGNGTAASAATAGTDYVVPSVAALSSLASIGTVTVGTWNATVIGGTYGGTGVNNGASTITIGGNVTHAGAFTTTLTVTANTSVTLPTSGTLLSTAAAVTGAQGGTGVNNGASTITIGGNVTVSGAFTTTLTVTAATSVTLPTSGTLLSTAAAVTPAQGGTGLATLTAHGVMLGEGVGNVAFAAIGTAGRVLVDQGAGTDPVFATTAIDIDSHYGVITADTDGATITFNLATSDWHTVTLGGNRTLAVSNGTTGQQFTIVLVQDGTGSRTVSSWFSTIKWAGGSAPTLTTTAGKADVFTFKQTGAGAYYGFVAGQNF